MNPALRTLTLVTALSLPRLVTGAEALWVAPRIATDQEFADTPTISFSIPRYTVTRLERETLATCLILEAASQGPAGMRAVMAVIHNRARGLPELLGPTVLREKQFSAFNKITAGREPLQRAIQRAQADRMWPWALEIVAEALSDNWRDPTYGATHYTRSAERTAWTRSLAKTVTIGAHSFYR